MMTRRARRVRTAKSTLVAATKMRTGERCIVAALTAARNAFKTTNVATIPLNTVERYINRTSVRYAFKQYLKVYVCEKQLGYVRAD